MMIIIIIIIIIDFLTSQLWLGDIHLPWDVVINRIRLGGLICSLKSFLQLNVCQELQIFCSCIYVLGWRLSLVILCDSDFGITPVDDITIGITCAAFCFHIAHISFASSRYLFCLSVIFVEVMCVWDSYVYQKGVLCFLIITIIIILLLLSSSSSSPLCRVFILTFLRQTVSLGNTVLQLFCCYYSWCLYR